MRTEAAGLTEGIPEAEVRRYLERRPPLTHDQTTSAAVVIM